MLKFLTRIFSQPAASPQQKIEDHVNSLVVADIHRPGISYEDRAAVTLLFLIGKQLLAMGLTLESVPAIPPYSSKNCRGYLFGVGSQYVISVGQPVEKELADNIVESAFMMVFGRTDGPLLARQTMAEFGPGSGLATGFMTGANEVEAAFHNGGGQIQCGCGFELFCSQDQS